MPADATVVQFMDDTTLRWSCRQGDYILWVRYASIFEDSYRLADVWERRYHHSFPVCARPTNKEPCDANPNDLRPN